MREITLTALLTQGSRGCMKQRQHSGRERLGSPGTGNSGEISSAWDWEILASFGISLGELHFFYVFLVMM